MEYCFLKGFLVVFMIQYYTPEGLSTPIQSSAVVTLQDDQALHPEPEVPPADIVPVMAPPSLKEVQQAVQVASEQVESRGAEEVLKVLMEKVVEAAMGQVERRSEAKRDEPAVQEAVTENILGADEDEADTKAEVEKKEVEGEYMGAKEEDTIVGKQQAEAERDAFKDVAEEGKGVVKSEGETAGRSMEEITTLIENGRREGVEEVINESLDTDVSQEVAKEMVAALEETGQNLTINETEVEDNNKQVVLSKEKGAHEPQTHQAEETPAVVKVARGGELESAEKSTLVMLDVEQTGDVGVKEEALVEETEVDEKEGEVMITPDSYETETKHSVLGELEEEDEEENLVENDEKAEVENKQAHTVVEEGVAKEKKAEETDVTEAAEGKKNGVSEISETLVNEEVDRQAGETEEAQVALETSNVPEDGAEVSVEQSLENQASTLSPSLAGVKTGENTLDDARFNHDNEIITPTNDLLPHDSVVAQPTLDNFEKDVLAEHSPAEGDKVGETNGLVEDTAGTTDTSELGLEAWKIGAISAAVFLVLETVVIFYILKCRNKNSTPALQRASEEACVEPEAATGGDCSDDTLPADNEDNEQIAARHPSNMASTLMHNKERHEEDHAIAMSDVTSTQELANNGPGQNYSQDLRTCIL